MRSARISFKNKKIWIIGGGKQALTRGRQFMEEGAVITFVAPSFRQELEQYIEMNQIPVIEGTYNNQLIGDGFLVYACTDNHELNHAIVVDANEKGLLSASVHEDEDASYHPLKSADYPNMHVAISTNGAFPSYNREILADIEATYESVHHERLERLRSAREAIMAQNLDVPARHKQLKEVLDAVIHDTY